MRIQSFENAKQIYERTKPVVSKTHWLEDDIRPLGERSRKYDRIMKLSRNCYALVCGGTRTGVSYWGERMAPKPEFTNEVIKRTAPIVWERRRDGYDYLTIHMDCFRNATGWFGFLRDYLPSGFGVPYGRNGTNEVLVYGETFYLPLNAYGVWFSRYHTANGAGEKLGQTPEFERALVFRMRAGEPPVLVNGQYKKHRVTKQVDIPRKQKYRGILREQRKWLKTMRPILEATWTYPVLYYPYNASRDEVAAYTKRKAEEMAKVKTINAAGKELLEGVGAAFGLEAGKFNPASVQFILSQYKRTPDARPVAEVVCSDPEHPFWFAFAVEVIRQHHAAENTYHRNDTTRAEKRFWDRYNRTLNGVLGLYK